MEQELNIAYDQKLTREVWQRVAQSLPPLEAPAADTGSCGIAAPPPEDSTHRLRRFIDEELSMARAYRRQVRCAPPSARRTLLRLSDEELAHARTLLAAHYLLTGRYYRPPTPVGEEPRSSWCRLLRAVPRGNLRRLGLRPGCGRHGGRVSAGHFPPLQSGGVRPRRLPAAPVGKQLDNRE